MTRISCTNIFDRGGGHKKIKSWKKFPQEGNQAKYLKKVRKFYNYMALTLLKAWLTLLFRQFNTTSSLISPFFYQFKFPLVGQIYLQEYIFYCLWKIQSLFFEYGGTNKKNVKDADIIFS